MKKHPIAFYFDAPGRPPIALGLFRMADTHGFSLSDSIAECRKNGVAPGLPAFVCDAVLAGWPIERALNRIDESLRDIGESLPDNARRGLALAVKTPEKWSSKGLLAEGESK